MVFNLDNMGTLYQTRDKLSLLDSLPYIEREFVDSTPSSIPLMELADMEDVYFARYSDLEDLASIHEISIQEAARDVQDANLLPSSRFVVAMEEWRPLLNPSIVDEFPNVLLIKEVNTPTYQACESCMSMFMETKDMLYVDLFLEADNASMTQYHLKAERLQSQIDAATEQIKKMRQNDPNYANAQKRLLGMQDALEKTQRMMEELEKRGSKSTADPNAKEGAVVDARKAGEARGQEFAQRAANGFKNPNTPPQQSADASQDQNQPQSWWAQKWSAFKNWMNNLGSNVDQKSTWFTNMINKVKSKFNGGAQETQASNQAQQQASQTKQPTKSDNTTSQPQGTAAEQITGQVVGKGKEMAHSTIDNIKDNAVNAIKDATGMDLSGVADNLANDAKQFVDTKADQVGAQGAKALQQGIDTAMDAGKKVVKTVSNTVNGGGDSSKGGKTTVTTREVAENEVPPWAKQKLG